MSPATEDGYRGRERKISSKAAAGADLLDGIVVTPDAVRVDCQKMVRDIARLVSPGETSREKQYRQVERLTGIPARRIKDLWHGYVVSPPACQERTLKNAYRVALAMWRESALRQLESIEAERAESNRVAADRSDPSGERARVPGDRTGLLGPRTA